MYKMLFHAHSGFGSLLLLLVLLLAVVAGVAAFKAPAGLLRVARALQVAEAALFGLTILAGAALWIVSPHGLMAPWLWGATLAVVAGMVLQARVGKVAFKALRGGDASAGKRWAAGQLGYLLLTAGVFALMHAMSHL